MVVMSTRRGPPAVEGDGDPGFHGSSAPGTWARRAEASPSLHREGGAPYAELHPQF